LTKVKNNAGSLNLNSLPPPFSGVEALCHMSVGLTNQNRGNRHNQPIYNTACAYCHESHTRGRGLETRKKNQPPIIANSTADTCALEAHDSRRVSHSSAYVGHRGTNRLVFTFTQKGGREGGREGG
jgi:hypothetical protein